MVGGDTLHACGFGQLAAHDIAAANNNRGLNATLLKSSDFACDFGDGLIINNPMAAVSGEGFAGELEQHAGPFHGSLRAI